MRARAGVSVWQILTPPLLVIVRDRRSVGRRLQSRIHLDEAAGPTRIESDVFGGRSNPWGDLWLRQKSVDGQAIIHARGKEANGTKLSRVEVFNFDDKGNFIERVDAELGRAARRVIGNCTTPRW